MLKSGRPRLTVRLVGGIVIKRENEKEGVRERKRRIVRKLLRETSSGAPSPAAISSARKLDYAVRMGARRQSMEQRKESRERGKAVRL